ncbi:MAG: PA14 domain-containing protein [Trueperaceae bacterium]
MKRFRKLALLLLVLLAACAQPPQQTEETMGSSVVGGTGLAGEYFDNIDFTGTMEIRTDATIDFAASTTDPISGIAATTYSIRWTGQVVPEYGEEYTFYLTHTDGARLMVNGQVLVDNWNDQSQITDSGTVTLQAGVRYDIRIESYRNATNAGMIKLEWQSTTRIREIVPKDRLFPTGSNANDALTLAKTATNFPADFVDDPLNTVGVKTPTNFSLVAREQNKRALISAKIRDNRVTGLYYVSAENSTLTLKDLLANRTYELGASSTYFGTNGGQIESQRQALLDKIARALSRDEIGVNSGATSSTGSLDRIEPQGVVDQACTYLVELPQSCTQCEDEAEEYREEVCSLTEAIVVDFFSTIIVPEIKIAFGLELADGSYSLVGDAEELVDDREEFRKCTGGQIPSDQGSFVPACPQPLTIDGPTPSSVSVVSKVSDGGSRDITIGNSASSGRPLVMNVLYVADGGIGQAGVNVYVDGMVGKLWLSPGESTTIRLYYNCPSTPTSASGKVLIYHNATNALDSEPLTVPVSLECVAEGTPAIGLPETATMSTNWDKPTSTSVTITNSGGGVLDWTIGSLVYRNPRGETYTPLEPMIGGSGSGELAPNSSASITFTGSCVKDYLTITYDPQYTAYVEIESKSNSSIKKTIAVSLICRGAYGHFLEGATGYCNNISSDPATDPYMYKFQERARGYDGSIGVDLQGGTCASPNYEAAKVKAVEGWNNPESYYWLSGYSGMGEILMINP